MANPLSMKAYKAKYEKTMYHLTSKKMLKVYFWMVLI